MPKASTLASSSAASTSSNKQKGTVLTFRIANNKLIAVNVFSPPDRSESVVNFLPGGLATISTPVVNKSSGLVRVKSALPPPNNSLKTCLNSSLIFWKVLLNSSYITPSISFIISSKVSSAFNKSSF